MDPNGPPIPLSPENILEMANAFQRSRVLLTAVELGLFTVLGERRLSSAEIATACKTDARATDRLCNALCALGLLVKSGATYGNTLAAAQFLARDSADYLAGLDHTANMFRSWGTLTQAVRKGTQVLDSGLQEREQPWFNAFIRAMHHRAKHSAAALVALLDLSGVKRVLDVGGGSGAYAIAFAQAKPDIAAVILDLPQVVPLAQTYVEEAGLGSRVRARVCDYLTDDFGRGYDLVFFSAIVHINAPDKNQQLINKAYAALNPKGKIVVQDFVMDEDRTTPARGALFALNMLVQTTDGDTYTTSEVSGWFAAAGAKNIRRIDSGPDTAMIVGEK